MTVTMSGSLPAFYFLILEAMVDAGVHLGLPRDLAFDLASAGFAGSAQYAIAANQNDSPLAQLKGKVTSPGGVTASALFKAEQLGLRNVVAEMVWAG
jgi:pyrroline-5-carboxylate reductase